MTRVDDAERELREITLQKVSDDFTGLWELPSILRLLHKNLTAGERKRVTLSVIRDLYQRRMLRAGHLDKTGRRLIDTDMSPEQLIEFIEREWTKLGRDPDIGDIIWLGPPD